MLDPDLDTGRVLVVEDDAEIADVLRRTLRQEGHEVRSAGDGVAALEVAEDFVPDLVILDLGLPKLDGVEVCRRLPGEAVRAQGAARPHARADAPPPTSWHRVANGRGSAAESRHSRGLPRRPADRAHEPRVRAARVPDAQ